MFDLIDARNLLRLILPIRQNVSAVAETEQLCQRQEALNNSLVVLFGVRLPAVVHADLEL